jgi:hypothetical protein
LIGVLGIKVAVRGQIHHEYALRGNLRWGSAWGIGCSGGIRLWYPTAQWRLWIASARAEHHGARQNKQKDI